MRWRLAVIAGLVLLQLAVPVWYGSSVGADGPFLDTQDLADQSNASVGQEVVVYGQVTALDPLVISHRLEEGGTIRIRVVDIDRGLKRGQYLEVYGTVAPDGAVVARGTVVRGEYEHWYTYGVSVVGVLLVLGRVARDWRFDRATWTVTPREETDA